MRTATLRQSGGSVIVSLPKAALEKLGLGPDDPVEIDVEGDRIIIRRRRRGRIGLAARLAMCDFSQPMSDEEREWIDAPDVGREADWLKEDKTS